MRSFCGQEVGGVDLAVVRIRIAFLPGKISFLPERVTVMNRNEKSAEAVVVTCMERRLNEEESRNYVSQTCMASEARATGAD